MVRHWYCHDITAFTSMLYTLNQGRIRKINIQHVKVETCYDDRHDINRPCKWSVSFRLTQ